MPPDDAATPGDDVDLDELERLAKAAEFMVAVQPAALLALLADLRALTADRDAHRAAAQEAEAERDTLRAENERLMANAGVGGYSADAPDEVLLCGFADHGCDAWIHAVRLCPDNGKLDPVDVEAIARGQYTQPVRYVRADKALAPAAPPGDAGTTAVTTKPVPVGRDCPTCGSRMYPWDANRVYPNAESRVEMRCVSCGHRVPM